MPAQADPQAPHSPASLPFDPPGDVLTTYRLEAHVDRGKPMLNNYTRYAKVGGGQHGEVYLCYKLNTRLPHGHPERRIAVAMKSVKRDNPRAEQLKRLRQQRLPTSPHMPLADKLNTTEAKIRKEIAIMKKCRHPHVVRLFEVIDDRMKDKIYMVMEYLGGGEVKWRNERNQPILTVEQTRRIMRDAIVGLEYLHHQGIIHRDIKPANLLWTEDRRMVKIGDFGVSHFSYAQRLAAAGQQGSLEDPEDPILLDDSDLTRRAGTPSFLAPEIVYEHTFEPPPSPPLTRTHTNGSSSSHRNFSSQSLVAPNTNRPPITKAIDIWALGVTLYCLLFGRTPFVADPATPSSEWSLYNSICNSDWSVDDTMGFDQISTGGRHPIREDSEGAIVLHLLDHFLEKDVRLRITLAEVKSSVWFLRDLPDPRKWLQVTSPTKISVTVDETSDAMSTVHFRWNWGAQITRRISSLFRTVRSQRSRDRIPEPQDEGRGPVRSEPHIRIGRRREVTMSLYEGHETTSQPDAVFKGGSGPGPRQRDSSRPPPLSKHKHAKQQPVKGGARSKSIDRWPASSSSSSSPRTHGHGHGPGARSMASTSTILVPPTSRRTRRGSETVVTDQTDFSSQPSPTSSDRPRARFALFLSSISHWRPNKYSPHTRSPTESSSPSSSATAAGARAGAGAGAGARSSTDVSSPPSSSSSSAAARFCNGVRRSEEALRRYRSSHSPGASTSANLSAARRASSWVQGDQPDVDDAEVSSLKSANAKLNDHDMNVGAGGISNDRSFVPRTSSRLTAGPLTPEEEDPDADANAGAGAHGEPPLDDEEQLYGPPCFDDDSSTIASAFGHEHDDGGEDGWQDGRFLDDDDDGDEDDEFADDSDTPEDEDGVVFSPRKRADIS